MNFETLLRLHIAYLYKGLQNTVTIAMMTFSFKLLIQHKLHRQIFVPLSFVIELSDTFITLSAVMLTIPDHDSQNLSV